MTATAMGLKLKLLHDNIHLEVLYINNVEQLRQLRAVIGSAVVGYGSHLRRPTVTNPVKKKCMRIIQ